MIRGASIVLVLLGAAGLLCGQGGELPVEDLELPVATYPGGNIKTIITASKTFALAGGSVRASGVKVKYFEKDGKTVSAVVDVEKCTYDRESETVASADAKINLKKGTISVTGVGFELKAKQERVVIHKDVRVVFQRSAVVKGKKD